MSKQPFKFYLDADPIAYMGSSSAEPPVYYWVRKENGEIVETSQNFSKAKDVLEWIHLQCWEENHEDLGWERIAGKADKGLESAYDATEEVLKDYLKTAKLFCREGMEPAIQGFLTHSGTKKTKDVKGLEDKYQGNRTGERPKYLQECKQYLLDKYPNMIILAKEGIEADCYVVGLAEKAGEAGCTMSIDKDIDQVEGCYHIDMNEPSKYRTCKLTQGIGDLWKVSNAKGKEKIKGDGFKFLAFQAITGDVTDGYKGLNGIGQFRAFDVLEDCKTKKECVDALLEVYHNKCSKGYICKKMKAREEPPELIEGIFQYESWDGQDIKKTPEELLQQHFELAYQERSPKDKFHLSDYLV